MKVSDSTLKGWLKTVYTAEPPIAYEPKYFADYGYVLLNQEKLKREQEEKVEEAEEQIDKQEMFAQASELFKKEKEAEECERE